MLSQSLTAAAAPTSTTAADKLATSDYALVRRAIGFLTAHWTEHPSLDDLAAAMQLSPTQTQKLFKRWCGLSPKEFVQAIAIDHGTNGCSREHA